jgi:hypothetical protein
MESDCDDGKSTKTHKVLTWSTTPPVEEVLLTLVLADISIELSWVGLV